MCVHVFLSWFFVGFFSEPGIANEKKKEEIFKVVQGYAPPSPPPNYENSESQD